jgi:hypothetical protein
MTIFTYLGTSNMGCWDSVTNTSQDLWQWVSVLISPEGEDDKPRLHLLAYPSGEISVIPTPRGATVMGKYENWRFQVHTTTHDRVKTLIINIRGQKDSRGARKTYPQDGGHAVTRNLASLMLS